MAVVGRVHDDLVSISDASGSGDSELTEPDELSGAVYERFVRQVRIATRRCMAISWWHYSAEDTVAGWNKCVRLASVPYLRRWYVGVTKLPFKRMVKGDPADPSYAPHIRKGYHCMYILVASMRAGVVETEWIAGLTELMGRAKRGNKGDGHEHVPNRPAFRFVYLCCQWSDRGR